MRGSSDPQLALLTSVSTEDAHAQGELRRPGPLLGGRHRGWLGPGSVRRCQRGAVRRRSSPAPRTWTSSSWSTTATGWPTRRTRWPRPPEPWRPTSATRHSTGASAWWPPTTPPGRSTGLGPTASGKSALALAVAERHGGVIINADSMQVYRDLRIITARPTPEDEARVPHRLYGHVDAAENYSVGRWCRDVARGDRRGRGAGRRADPGRRHRALFQGADAGLVGGAADRRPTSAPRCARALRSRGRGRAARRTVPGAIRRRRSG